MPPKARVLYTSGELHAQIKRLFRDPSPNDRRVAIVAYVGADALSLLPRPEGVLVVCSPQPLATSHAAIQELVRRKATVRFSDRLHAKVYWSRRRGCIIGSANLSRNALGAKGLKEAGVLLPPGAVKIDRFLATAAPRKITQAQLDRLAVESRKAAAKGAPVPSHVKPRTFLDWYEAPFRDESWKLSWWDEERGFAKIDREIARQEYGVRAPQEFMDVAKGQTKTADWLLNFKVSGRARVGGCSWMFVDFVVKVPRSEPGHSPQYPYHAVQVHRRPYYPDPPFVVTPQFSTAFRKAVERYGLDRLQAMVRLKPPTRLLRLIAAFMKDV
jgi:hypothetical protein